MNNNRIKTGAGFLDDGLFDMELGQIVEHRVFRDSKFVLADIDVTKTPGGWIFHQCYYSSDHESRTISTSTCFVPDAGWVAKLGLMQYVFELIASEGPQDVRIIDVSKLCKTLAEPNRLQSIRGHTARVITDELTVEIVDQLARNPLFDRQILKAPEGFVYVPKGGEYRQENLAAEVLTFPIETT